MTAPVEKQGVDKGLFSKPDCIEMVLLLINAMKHLPAETSFQ
jgi:hypothetical protein